MRVADCEALGALGLDLGFALGRWLVVGVKRWMGERTSVVEPFLRAFCFSSFRCWAAGLRARSLSLAILLRMVGCGMWGVRNVREEVFEVKMELRGKTKELET